MLDLIVLGAFIFAAIVGFLVGLTRSKSRALINFIVLAGFFCLFRYLISVYQDDILRYVSYRIGYEIKPSLNSIFNQLSSQISNINSKINSLNEILPTLNLKLLPQKLADASYYNSILTTLVCVAAVYLSLIISIPLSYLISWILNIPFKIRYNKRNTVYTTNEKVKEIKVKVKTRFSKRIPSALITCVLGLGIAFYNIIPIYKTLGMVNKITTSIKKINFTKTRETIDNYYEVKNNTKNLIGETLTNEMFKDCQVYVDSIEQIITTAEYIQDYVKYLDTLNVIPTTSETSLINKINLYCFNLDYNGQELNMYDEFDAICDELVDSINYNLDQLSIHLNVLLEGLDLIV